MGVDYFKFGNYAGRGLLKKTLGKKSFLHLEKRTSFSSSISLSISSAMKWSHVSHKNSILTAFIINYSTASHLSRNDDIQNKYRFRLRVRCDSSILWLTFDDYIVNLELLVECEDGVPHTLVLQPSPSLGQGHRTIGRLANLESQIKSQIKPIAAQE